MKGSVIMLPVLFITISFLTARYSEVAGNALPNLWFIGSANGKSFFAETGERNWMAAKSLCESQHMKLAEILTAEEFDLLDSLHDSIHFHGLFWTGARDRRTHQQFAWHYTNLEVDQLAFGPSQYEVQEDVGSCLAFQSVAENSYGHIVPCKFSKGYTLCQA